MPITNSPKLATSQTWSRSEVQVTELEHIWSIDHFKYQNLDSLKSEIFSAHDPGNSRFYLQVTNFRTVDVRLCLESSYVAEFKVKWLLTVVNSADGKVKFSKCKF